MFPAMKKQTEMNLQKGKRGGRRKGAGRPRIKSRGVAHVTREKVNKKTPLHVNFKYRMNVRNKDTLKLLKKAIQNARKQGLKVLNYAFMHNHVHLVIEAANNEVLSRGMRSITITMARGLNKGRIQLERYHLHVLRTAREVKNAVYYVLFNEQRHDSGTCSNISDYTSLLSTPGWQDLVRIFVKKKRVTLRVRTGERWKGDMGSFLYQRGVDSLYHDQINRT